MAVGLKVKYYWYQIGNGEFLGYRWRAKDLNESLCIDTL